MKAEAGASPRSAPASVSQNMKLLNFFLVSIATVLVSAAASFVVAVGLLDAAGAPFFAVASESMSPGLHRGDLVVTRPGAPLRVGDVVTFRMYREQVTHRLVAAGREPGSFETRGDANPGNDPWTITERDVIGTVESVVTNAGWPLLWLSSVSGQLAVTGALVLAAAALMWVWPKVAYAQASP